MNKKSILLAGLPATGKTTFIAALWYYLNNSCNDQLLMVNSLAGGEHEYLNSISRDWAVYKTVARTRSNNGEKIQINVKNTKTDQIIVLDIPDFSGETFKSHFDTREWTEEYDKLLNKTNGFILFVDPQDANNTPHLITDADEAALLFEEPTEISNESIEFKQYSAEHTCNQVKLVEELQFIKHHKPAMVPLKIAVVISAWDVVEKSSEDVKVLPLEWLEKSMPLLYQYLVCNSTDFILQVFGVSAQGLEYNNEDINKALSKNRLDNIIVEDGTETSKDISKPIVWITE